MKTLLISLSLLLSSLSLGLQLQKKNISTPAFDRYMTPATISEYDFRVLLAEKEMIRDSMVLRKGIGVPFVHRLSPDHQRIICRAMVAEDYLPKSHDDQKEALMEAAWMAVGDVAVQFGLTIGDQASHAVTVEFINLKALGKNQSEKDRLYAEFVDGELTFH